MKNTVSLLGLGIFLMGSSTAMAGWSSVYSGSFANTNYMYIEPTGVGTTNQQAILGTQEKYLSAAAAQRAEPIYGSEAESCQFRLKIDRSISSTTSPMRATTYYAQVTGVEIAPDQNNGKHVHFRFEIPEYRGNNLKLSLSFYRGSTPQGVKIGSPSVHAVVPLPYFLNDMKLIRSSDLETRKSASKAFAKERFGDGFDLQVQCPSLD